jgi:hypothetical protein
MILKKNNATDLGFSSRRQGPLFPSSHYHQYYYYYHHDVVFHQETENYCYSILVIIPFAIIPTTTFVTVRNS